MHPDKLGELLGKIVYYDLTSDDIAQILESDDFMIGLEYPESFTGYFVLIDESGKVLNVRSSKAHRVLRDNTQKEDSDNLKELEKAQSDYFSRTHPLTMDEFMRGPNYRDLSDPNLD